MSTLLGVGINLNSPTIHTYFEDNDSVLPYDSYIPDPSGSGQIMGAPLFWFLLPGALADFRVRQAPAAGSSSVWMIHSSMALQGGDGPEPGTLELDSMNITYGQCNAGQWQECA